MLLAKKQVSQSVIRMGHLGLEKNNPDQYAVRVMDYILGGGFTSRLTQEIRSNQGLAYHAGSRFDIGRRFPGIFMAQTETKSESTVKAITLMNDIIAGMTKELVSEEELSRRKSRSSTPSSSALPGPIPSSPSRHVSITTTFRTAIWKTSGTISPR